MKKSVQQSFLRLLKLHRDAHVGHLGGDLSCMGIILTLFHHILQKDDLFLLSKGHSAGALYTALWSTGVLSEEELQTFTKDDTMLGVHPPVNYIPEIIFGTGSLGHGLSLCTGMALAKKLKGESGRVFCLGSDGETQEGSVWEALGFAVNRKLDNLCLLVDVNGLQGFGRTADVWSQDIDVLAQKAAAFGADVTIVHDGHDTQKMLDAEKHLPSPGKPSVVLFQTVKGYLMPFFEDKLESHYLPLTEEQYLTGCSRIREKIHA